MLQFAQGFAAYRAFCHYRVCHLLQLLILSTHSSKKGPKRTMSSTHRETTETQGGQVTHIQSYVCRMAWSPASAGLIPALAGSLLQWEGYTGGSSSSCLVSFTVGGSPPRLPHPSWAWSLCFPLFSPPSCTGPLAGLRGQPGKGRSRWQGTTLTAE